MKASIATRFGFALATAALVSMAISPTTALAADAPAPSEKDETVHIYTSADGSVKSSEVDARLHNPDGSATLSDVTNLSDITESGDKGGSGVYTQSNDDVVWQTSGKDVTYKGTTTAESPVKVKVVYRFNGSVITPRELVGKSGRVDIRYEYENTSYVIANIDGASERIYTPFIAVTGMILDNTKFTNIAVENGRTMEDGDSTIVVGFAMPGMQESLGVGKDKLDMPSYFQVSADVKNFELKSTLTMITPNGLNDVDLSSLDASEYSGSASRLQKGMVALIESSGQLGDGLQKLSDGSALMKAQAQKLPESASQLARASGALKEGLGKAAAGVEELKAGAAQVNSGTQQLAGGIGVAKDAIDSALIPALSSSSKALDVALADLQSAGDAKTALEKIAEAAQVTVKLKTDSESAKNDLAKAASDLAGLSFAAPAADAEAARIAALQAESGLASVDAAVASAKTALKGIDTNGMTSEQKAAINSAIGQLNGIDTSQVKADATTAATKAKSAHDALAGADSKTAAANAALAGDAAAFAADAATLKDDAVAMQSIDPSSAPLSDAASIAKMHATISGAKDGIEQIKGSLAVLSKGGTLPDGSKTGGLAGALSALGSAKTPGTILFATNALYQGALALGDDGTGLPAAYLAATQLASGAHELNASAPLLIEGVETLSDGMQAAADGSEKLTDGLKKFDSEGLSRIVEMLDGDVVKTVDRLQAIQDAGRAYTNFSGITPGTAGSVKFVYETEAIEAK